MEEIWKDIKDYETLYQASNSGQIKRLCQNKPYFKRDKIIKLSKTKDGYLRLGLIDINKKIKTFSLHRLIALTFIPNMESKPTVNHKDGNKLNNNVENLEWATRKEQMVHASKTGLLKSSVGIENANNKLDELSVMEIIKL